MQGRAGGTAQGDSHPLSWLFAVNKNRNQPGNSNNCGGNGCHRLGEVNAQASLFLMSSLIHNFSYIVTYMRPVAVQHHPVSFKAAGNIMEVYEVSAGNIKSRYKTIQKDLHILPYNSIHVSNIRFIREKINPI